MKKTEKTVSVLLAFFFALLCVFPAGGVSLPEAKVRTTVLRLENADLLSFYNAVHSLISAYDAPEEYFADVSVGREELALIAAGTSLGGGSGSFGSAMRTALPAIRAKNGVSGVSDAADALPADLTELTALARADGFSVRKTDGDRYLISKPCQTKRLIVKAETLPRYYGAAEALRGPDGLWILQYRSEDEASLALRSLKRLSYVAWAAFDTVRSACEYLSWGYGQDYVDMNNFNSWFASAGEPAHSVTVAVIDTGAASDHAFLENRLDTENDYDFVNNDDDAYDDNGHGTHVSGIIADGTLPNVTVLPVKVLNADGAGTDLEVYSGIRYAIERNVDVINMSLGGEGSCELYEEAINDAVEKGIIVCVAAGNETDDAENHTPANVKSAITVAATDQSNALAEFSNFGDVVDLSAPGVDILSAFPYDPADPDAIQYAELSGTSMATPHVAAACACLKAFNKEITSETAMELLSGAANPVSEEGMGAGILCMKNVVSPDASRLIVNTDSVSLFPGGFQSVLAVTGTGEPILWSSSDESVATVTEGVITAHRNGECEILASVQDQTRRIAVSVSELTLTLPAAHIDTYVGLDTEIAYETSH